MRWAAPKPKQSLGQNFLTDKNIASNIVKAIAPAPSDTMLEIGPGMGVLTELLQPRVEKLLAVEIDQRLAAILSARFREKTNFVLIENDFLKIDLALLAPAQGLRIVGNIPYHITSPILFKIFDHTAVVRDLHLLIQKEVAMRVTAAPKSKEYGILSVMSQIFADVKTVLYVPNTVFLPRPKVASALVRWSFTPARSRLIRDLELFRCLVRRGFGQRRKMLRNSLSDWVADRHLEFDFTQRPEDLAVGQWIELANALAE